MTTIWIFAVISIVGILTLIVKSKDDRADKLFTLLMTIFGTFIGFLLAISADDYRKEKEVKKQRIHITGHAHKEAKSINGYYTRRLGELPVKINGVMLIKKGEGSDSGQRALSEWYHPRMSLLKSLATNKEFLSKNHMFTYSILDLVNLISASNKVIFDQEASKESVNSNILSNYIASLTLCWMLKYGIEVEEYTVVFREEEDDKFSLGLNGDLEIMSENDKISAFTQTKIFVEMNEWADRKWEEYNRKLAKLENPSK